jgi:hypothetical protein
VQHSAHLIEHRRKPLKEAVQRRLKPKLAVDAIVAQAVVGRRCDTALDGIGGQASKFGDGITAY